MKTRISVCLLFAALGLLIQGCGPETRITGRVLDDQTGTAVPGTAVLGMVWLEDADKALPVPDTGNLKSEDRDIALDKDTTDRGLPAAYARTFADSSGRFELADFHFSAATKKAVKAMKQPKITRVTMWAFQKGYRKQAVTMFPKAQKNGLPNATMLLARPADWKELYVDNIVDTLTQDFMLKGYSKEFGATKAEKSWIFEYTRANEQRAYNTSDIKGDKKMEEMCGHDYSDIIVSTAGMQRNPAREKCGELLKRIGAIREVEELWLAHSNIKQDPLAAAKEVVRQALNTLSAETAEPKKYEAAILAGLEAAGKTQSKDVMRNSVIGNAWQDEAKLLYGKGDKAAAYRALGYALYSQLSEEIQEGAITAQLSARTIPGIKETTAGFYLLMNRPLTAQLPGGDNGNHKDKPGYKVEGATETVTIYKTITTLPVPADQGKTIRLINVNEISPSNITSPTPEREYVHGTENQDVLALVDSDELDFSSSTVSFFDSKGNPRGKWMEPGGISRWEFSRDGRYFFVTMWPLPSEQIQAETPLETRIVPTFILNSSGTVLYQFESSLEPGFRFAPSGNYLYRYLKDGFEIFELDGTLKWAHKCLAGPYISRNDAYIVSLETKTKLAIYNMAGKLLNTVEVPELNVDKLQPSVRTVSDDGDIFVYFESNVKQLIALDRNGKTLKRLQLKEFPSSPRFADKEKNEVIIDVWEHINPSENRKREIKLR